MSRSSMEISAQDFLRRAPERGGASRAELIAHLSEHGFKPTVEFLWGLGIDHNDGLCPPFVSEFFVKLLVDHSPQKILNPWLSEGSLLKPICEQFPSAEVFGISRYVAHLSSAKHLLKDARTRLLHSIESVSENEIFDLIVAVLPFNMKPLTSASLDGVDLHDHQENVVLARALRHLSEVGTGIFVVAPSFFTSSHRHRLFSQLGSLGYYVDAAFSMPPGTFKPMCGIETYVVVIRRGEVRPIFVAEAKRERVEIVLQNYRQRKTGESPEFGIFADAKSFVGLSPLVNESRFRALVKRSKHAEVPFESILLNVKTFTGRDAKYEPHENAFLLSRGAPFRICSVAQEVPANLREWVQLIVDPSKASAAIVAKYLQSPIGQLALKSAASGNMIPRLPLQGIGQIPILVPSTSDQSRILELDDRLALLMLETRELQQRLWAPNVDVKRIGKAVHDLNRVDSFPDWLDSLPFPLASILWAYHAASNDPLRGYLTLLHFFEALGQFLATVLISAVLPDTAVFSQLWESVRAVMKDRFSWERPTFGMWIEVFGCLAKVIRTDIHNTVDEARYWQRVMACDDLHLLQILVSKDMVSLLERANQKRNMWHGHGNALAHNEMRHEECRRLLLEFRELVGTKWSSYPLILAKTARKSRGKLQVETQLLMGPRTPFASKEFTLTDNLEQDVMHLVGEESGNFCELLPFIRLGPNPTKPTDTCYFYNGLRQGHVEFLVYQSQVAEIVTESVADFGIHLERLR